MSEDDPYLGEVREFQEHKVIPLSGHGFALNEPIRLGALAIMGELPHLRTETVTVERVWDGERWVRGKT